MGGPVFEITFLFRIIIVKSFNIKLIPPALARSCVLSAKILVVFYLGLLKFWFNLYFVNFTRELVCQKPVSSLRYVYRTYFIRIYFLKSINFTNFIPFSNNFEFFGNVNSILFGQVLEFVSSNNPVNNLPGKQFFEMFLLAA